MVIGIHFFEFLKFKQGCMDKEQENNKEAICISDNLLFIIRPLL